MIPSITPVRAFEDHDDTVYAVAVFPDRQCMVTGSEDKTLRLLDLKDDEIVSKKMEGHQDGVLAISVSGNGQLIASGDFNGNLIAWDGNTGERLKIIKAYSSRIYSLNFSPDGTVLATCSPDTATVRLWNTKTWQPQPNPIRCRDRVWGIRYSPLNGEHLAIATEKNIQIWKPGTMECIANFKGHRSSQYLTHVDTRCTSSHIGQ